MYVVDSESLIVSVSVSVRQRYENNFHTGMYKFLQVTLKFFWRNGGKEEGSPTMTGVWSLKKSTAVASAAAELLQ